MNQRLFKNTMIISLLALAISTHAMGTSKTRLDVDEQEEEVGKQQQQEAISLSPINPSPMSLFPKTHLHFHNLLGNGHGVSLHPQSVSFDFGTHLLTDGQTQELIFHPFFIAAFTDIRCDFLKKDGNAIGLVYHYSRDWKRCYKNCLWNITPQGVFGINRNGEADVRFQWWPNSNVSSWVET